MNTFLEWNLHAKIRPINHALPSWKTISKPLFLTWTPLKMLIQPLSMLVGDRGPIWNLFCIFAVIWLQWRLISTQGATNLLIQVEYQEMIASIANPHEIGILDFLLIHTSESTGWRLVKSSFPNVLDNCICWFILKSGLGTGSVGFENPHLRFSVEDRSFFFDWRRAETTLHNEMQWHWHTSCCCVDLNNS